MELSELTPEQRKAWEDEANRSGYTEDDGVFSQKQVQAYDPDANKFNLGGDPNFAANRAAGLAAQGQEQGAGQRAQGVTEGNQLTTQGIAGAVDAGHRASEISSQGTQGNAVQTARALGFEGQGSQALTQGASRAGDQAAGARQSQANAQYDSRVFGDRSQNAQMRPDIAVQNGAQLSSDRALESQGRSDQYQAAQALGYRANDGSGQTNTQGLRSFAGQTGTGPSVAESQLQGARDQSMGSSLALARSGRGNNTQAVRSAMFQNAATEQATNQQLATLRATEHDQAQNRQLGALSAESQAQLGYRGQDIGALQAQASTLGQARGQDQSQQQLGIGQGQFNANLQLQSQQQRDAAALGWAGQQQTAAARGDTAYFQGQQLGNQSIAQGQQQDLGLHQLGQHAIDSGQQFQLGTQGLANQAIGQGQQFQVGMAGAGNQANLGLQGLGNQYDLGAQGLSNQVSATQLQADMGLETMRSNNAMAASTANAQADTASDAAVIQAGSGLISGLGGAAALSDKRTKKNVSSLKGSLADEYAALGGDRSQEDTTDYPRLPENTRYAASGDAPRSGESEQGFADRDPEAFDNWADRNGWSGSPNSAGRKALSHADYPDAPPIDRDALDAAYRRQGGEPHEEDPYDLASSKRAADPYDMWASSKHGAHDRPTGRTDRNALSAFAPRVDLRQAAGSRYEYKDPSMPGAASGEQVGPMAQDLERSPATRHTIQTGPDGFKRVDTPRLTLTNTAAISDQQRDIQELKAALAANNGDKWHPRGNVDVSALDDVYRRNGGYQLQH